MSRDAEYAAAMLRSSARRARRERGTRPRRRPVETPAGDAAPSAAAPAPAPSAAMQRNRVALAAVFAAAVGHAATVMGLRDFLRFAADVAIVPELLSAQVAAELLGEAAARASRGGGERGSEWQLAFADFLGVLCAVAERAFDDSGAAHATVQRRQAALLRFLAARCLARFGVELDVGGEESGYRPGPALLAASPGREEASDEDVWHSPLAAEEEEPGEEEAGGEGELDALRRRLEACERELRAERKEKGEIAVHADRACAAMEQQMKRMRQQEDGALRALSPCADVRRGRAVLGTLAVGIIGRQRLLATAGWWRVWRDRVRMAAAEAQIAGLQRAADEQRARADEAVRGAEEALTEITLRDEGTAATRLRALEGPREGVPRLVLEPAPASSSFEMCGSAQAASTPVNEEVESWRRRAQAEARTRAEAERLWRKDQTKLAAAERQLARLGAARLRQAEYGAQRCTRRRMRECLARWREHALRAGQVRLAVERMGGKNSQLSRGRTFRQWANTVELSRQRRRWESATSTALRESCTELRRELRESESEADRATLLGEALAARGARMRALGLALSRWRALLRGAAEATLAHRKVLLVVLLLHHTLGRRRLKSSLDAWRQHCRMRRPAALSQ